MSIKNTVERGQSSRSCVKVLCVDLDGTLVSTDTLEAGLAFLEQKTLFAVLLPWCLLGGKAFFNHQISRQIVLGEAQLPYDSAVMEFLSSLKNGGP